MSAPPREELFAINKNLFILINLLVISGLLYGIYLDSFELGSHISLNITNALSVLVMVIAFPLALRERITKQQNIAIVHMVVVVNLTITAVVNALDGFPVEYGLLSVLVDLAMAGSATFLVDKRLTLVFGVVTFSLYTFLAYFSNSSFFHLFYPLIAIVILGFTLVMYLYRGFISTLSTKLANIRLDLEDSNLILRRLKEKAEHTNIQNRPFVVFGKNTAGLIHDFKNDLALIMTTQSTIALKLERGLEVQPQDLDGIRRGLELLNERIERVKYVTSAHEDASAEQIDLYTLVERTIYPFQLTEEVKKYVSFHLSYEDPRPVIHARRYIVLQVIENLVRNSCEAIIDQAIAGRIDIRVSRTATEARVIIQDTGPGISFCFDCKKPNCMDCNVFEIGKTTKPSGSGFGMTNVIQAMRQLDGGIHIESQSDQGTRVEISIPLSQDLR